MGFVDDDQSKKGLRIHGFKVLGTTDELPQLIARHHITQILIAIPSASGQQMQRMIDKCLACKVDFKTLPPIRDIINGAASTKQIRNVRLADLLGRQPVSLDLEKIRGRLVDKVILITGAGGSIGSELARQVAKFGPRQLILFERSENDLHQIDIELAEHKPRLNYVTVVGDILDVGRLREAIVTYKPHSIFHAAAYKHVPMMEKNCFQAVMNNIFGTYNAALLASQCGVKDFVLISSDKAVNPTNIMGVTKRVAEMIILGLQHQSTRFVAVRFGNVLGSNGSVLPLFEKQVANRMPVTVTDPEAKRYFMTIPEAVQLVLQASAMGQGGEIFVLDMGEPIKIVDLAKSVIRLSGLELDRDIKIIFTGFRPGEKPFEELSLEGEQFKHTAHEKICVLDAGKVNFNQMRVWLSDLAAAVEAKNMNAVITKLKEMVPEYSPSESILSLCEFDRYDRFITYNLSREGLSSPINNGSEAHEAVKRTRA
jgi:FlaA1/EpsC-like NDP-sugar epimerase